MRKRYEDKLERPEKLDLETGHGAGFVNEFVLQCDDADFVETGPEPVEPRSVTRRNEKRVIIRIFFLQFKEEQNEILQIGHINYF